MDDLLRLPTFEPVAPGPTEVDAACAAFVAYGKGSGHPADLNFGVAISYALAKVRGPPLLYKGGDFAQKDIASALTAVIEPPRSVDGCVAATEHCCRDGGQNVT